MADLGFLPAVRRLLTRTPRAGQRLLFSATLDKAIDVLVRQFLTNPVTHQADSAQSPVTRMDHHVLHIEREHRLAILADLTSAPGRTVVFTRTKHGAKGLARQLNGRGIPAVELHGNLGQSARTRNLDAFHSGQASVLVATDIAARGIHVDDVTLVVHADPPAEAKAYLHRSGRTARAGNAGTVVTLMTGEQVRDVRDLTRAAAIKPTTTRVNGADHPILQELAPGERVLGGAFQPATGAEPARTRPAKAAGSRNRRRGGGAAGRKPADTATSRKPGDATGSRRRGDATGNAERPQSTGGARRRSSGPRAGAGRSRTGDGSGRSHSAAAFSAGRR
jgi:superfamily II DNA/RNA helicase